MSTNGKPKDHFGLVLAIPTRGTMRMEWALALRDLAMPLNCSHVIRTVIGKDVVEARNIAMKDALDLDAEYLVFLDDDVLIPPQALHRMFYLMRHNPDWDLLTGIVTTKTIQPEPCIFRKDVSGAFWDWKFPDTFPIDACGMAFCMIRLSTVKEKMSEPWFKWPKGMDEDTYREEGEDIYFCRRLQEAGGTLMADGGVLCGHLTADGKVITISEDDPPIRNADEGAFEGTRVLAR